MPKQYTDIALITGGCVRRSNMGYLAFQLDEHAKMNFAEVFFLGWNGAELCRLPDNKDHKWIVAGSAIAETPLEQLVVVSTQGEVYVTGSKDTHFEKIASSEGDPTDRGPLRCARCIDGKIYVCGMNRQIYRRDHHNAWTPCDDGARPPKDDKSLVGFESIDGFSSKDMYAAGWDGEIWHGDGKKWTQVDSPTNLVLTSVCCAGDGVVYACGRRGLIVAGRNDKWEVISQKALPADIWNLCWYKDKLYAASMQHLFTYDRKRGFEFVDMGEDTPSSCYWLSARDDVMWSIGAKDVMAFDGKTWTRIE